MPHVFQRTLTDIFPPPHILQRTIGGMLLSMNILQRTLEEMPSSPHVLQRMLGDMPPSPHILRWTIADMLLSSHIIQRMLADMPPPPHILQRTLGARYLGEHATIWNRVSSFLISVYLDLESWFKLRFFYLLCNIAFFRPSECYIQLRKYYVGRRDALSCRSKYFDGHHNAFSKCWNTLSAITMLYSVEASILSRVVMLSPIAEVLCRASECSIR